jgi:hypothetical protein
MNLVGLRFCSLLEKRRKCLTCIECCMIEIGWYIVMAPIPSFLEEGTLGAERHLEAHLINSQKEGGIKVLPLVGFQLLSHPHSNLGV